MELPGRRELREQILHQMDGRTSYVSDADVYREIDKAILRSGHSGYGTLLEKEELRRQMFSSIRGFDVLEKYLEDSSISEIMVIGASHIFVEQNGRVRRTRMKLPLLWTAAFRTVQECISYYRPYLWRVRLSLFESF